MQKDQLPGSCTGGDSVLQPPGLHGIGGDAIRLVGVAVQDDKMHRAALEIVIAFVAGQGEVIVIRLEGCGAPIMVPQHREEAVFSAAGAVSAVVRGNIIGLLAHLKRMSQILMSVGVS